MESRFLALFHEEATKVTTPPIRWRIMEEKSESMKNFIDKFINKPFFKMR